VRQHCDHKTNDLAGESMRSPHRNRGFEIPKASPESAALGIFDGLEKGEQEIFPDAASQPIAEGWRTGAVKALERQFAAFVPESAVNLG
jgi:hypothetical protein